MADYDDIGLPVKGQPVSSSLFGIKVRDYIIDLGRRMGIRESAEDLPDPTSGYGPGANTFTAAANVWATLPTNSAVATVVNPSTVFNMRCHVYFGAWMQIGSGGSGDVRLSINTTGGVVKNPDPGDNAPRGWGMIPVTSSLTVNQAMGYYQLLVPAGAAAVTLTAQGRRSNATGTNTQINYPTIEVIPFRFEIP